MKKTKVISRIISLVLVSCLLVTYVSATDISSFASNLNTDTSSFASDLDTRSVNQSQEYEARKIALSEYTLDNIPLKLEEDILQTKRTEGKTAVSIDNSNAEELSAFTIVNEDGSKTIYSYEYPIKYFDSKTEKIKFIDNSLIESGGLFSKTAFKTEGPVGVNLPKDIRDSITLDFNDASVIMAPLTQEKTKAVKKDFSFYGETQTVVEYANVFGEGIHLQYTPINFGIKENIFIEKNTGVNEFQFEITAKGLIPDKTEGDKIVFKNEKTGNEAFLLDSIWAMDSYVSEDEDAHLTYENSYRVETLKDGVYLVTIVVNKGFLEDETTIYPVLVDPTAAQINPANILRTTVCSNGTNWGTSTSHLAVGKHSNNYETMSYVKINNIANYRHINPNNVTAKLNMRQTYGTSSSYKVQCYDSGTAVNPANATYSSLSSNLFYKDSEVTCGANATYAWDITYSFKDWLRYALGEGGWSQDYGVILKADTTGRANKQFAATAATDIFITVTYNDDTSLPAGTYFIRNPQENRYLDAQGGGTPYNGQNVGVYGFNGNTNQQWQIKYLNNGFYSIRSVTNTNYTLDAAGWVDANGTNVQLWNSTSTAYQWRIIKNSDGTYRIMPDYSVTRGFDVHYGGGTGHGTNVHLYTYSGSGNNQKWVFEAATSVGNGGSYVQNNSTGNNCYAYALRDSSLGFFQVKNWTSGDSVSTIRSKVISQVTDDLGRTCRPLTSKNDLVNSTREYKIAIRVGQSGNWYDYHFWYQLSAGNWAEKQGGASSKQHSSSVNPDTDPWRRDVDGRVYDPNTLYIAVGTP